MLKHYAVRTFDTSLPIYIHVDVSQLSYLEDEPRDLCLSKREQVVVWALLFNGTILGFDPETRERVAKVVVFTVNTRYYVY